jgi:hypothetical protein
MSLLVVSPGEHLDLVSFGVHASGNRFCSAGPEMLVGRTTGGCCRILPVVFVSSDHPSSSLILWVSGPSERGCHASTRNAGHRGASAANASGSFSTP